VKHWLYWNKYRNKVI